MPRFRHIARSGGPEPLVGTVILPASSLPQKYQTTGNGLVVWRPARWGDGFCAALYRDAVLLGYVDAIIVDIQSDCMFVLDFRGPVLPGHTIPPLALHFDTGRLPYATTRRS